MRSRLLSAAHAPPSRSLTPHARLSPRQVSLLARLADPESVTTVELPPEASELSEVVIAADRHGVMPIVARNLAAAHVVRGSLFGEAARILDAHHDQLTVAVGQSMLLDHHAKRITDCFAAHGIVAEIVKGPGFADRLYRDRGDRQYTDIDFLVAPHSLDEANRVMPGVGFHRPQKAWDNSNRDCEYKWFLEGNRSILVELHGSLVHSRALRRCIPFGHAELLAARGEGNHVAIADLIVATIHASCGHKLHRLNMLVDVLQAARRVAATDEEVLNLAVDRLGARLEMGVTLGVASDLFGDERVRALAARFSNRWAVTLGRRLVTAEAVLAAQSGAGKVSRIRRHMFRQLQQVSIARP